MPFDIAHTATLAMDCQAGIVSIYTATEFVHALASR